MHVLLDILLGILVVLSTITAGYWVTVLYHMLRTLVRVPSLRAGLSASGSPSPATPSICVIVPAHNEQRVIATLVDALRAQDYPNFRVVFALDRCTDQTEPLIRARVAGDSRVEILSIDECPEPWVGKVHAIHRAATASAAACDAELLLFLDADTMPAPACLRAAAALMRHRGDDLLSVLSTLTYDRWFERVVQPVAGMELFRQYPMIRANDRADARPFANGQFILVRRSRYEEVGGHEAVKDEVLEDVWLARTFSRRGFACGFYFDGGLLGCRMYEQWERFRRGWLRIYGECASRKPGRLRRAAIIVRLLSCVFPVASLACLVLGLFLSMGANAAPASTSSELLRLIALWAGAAGFAAWYGVMSLTYSIGRAPVWASASSLVGAWLVGGLLNEAARNYERGRPVLWGGKEYQRDQR